MKYLLMTTIAASLLAVCAMAQTESTGTLADRNKNTEVNTAPSAEQLIDLLEKAIDIANTLSKKEANALPTTTSSVSSEKNPFAEAAVARLNEAAVGIFAQIGGSGNTIFSPVSLGQALRTVYAGAKNNTATQLRHALELDLFPLGYNFNSVELQSANAVWILDKELVLTEEFKEKTSPLGENVRVLASKTTADSLRMINEWFNDKTKGRIPALFDQLDETTKMVVGNAVFFKGMWETPFNKRLTRDRPFYGIDGTASDVKMMETAANLPIAKGENFAAIKIPYQGARFAMTVILPDKEVPFEQFVRQCCGANGLSPISSLNQKFRSPSFAAGHLPEVIVSLPKWEVESAFDLVPVLQALGITDAFTDAADFSGMVGDQTLMIDQVMQKANITVDEEGTVAAAATGIGVKMGLSQPPVVFTADRPFIYYITEENTGLIVFIGTVVQP
jgi:serpin B